MKIKSAMIATIMALTSLSAIANNSPEIYMEGNVYDLAWISDSKVSLRVDYAGTISGLCALRFDSNPYSSVTMKDILNEVNMTHTFGQVVTTHTLDGYPNAIIADLLQGRFVDTIVIEAKSGELLSELFKKLNTNVIVTTVPCAKNDLN